MVGGEGRGGGGLAGSGGIKTDIAFGIGGVKGFVLAGGRSQSCQGNCPGC